MVQKRVIVFGVLTLLVAMSIVAMRHIEWPISLERKVDAMQPGWIKRSALIALALMTPATSGVAQTSSTSLPAPSPTVIGMNVAAPNYYASAVPFANLAIGSDWLDTRWQKLPDEFQDGFGNIRSLPADGMAFRFLSIPPTKAEGFEVRCTFAGSGTLTVAGPAQQIASGANMLRLHVVNMRGKESAPWLVLTNVDPKRPPRNLDCRDARLASSARFRPEFINTLRGYQVIRFMDWQNANANVAVSWDQRNMPTGSRLDRDGVSIEDMLALAHELDADPWFVMPWNASDDYIARFARMVGARLPAGRSVYVEAGTEVWNTAFPVAQQALKEGVDRKLGTDPREAAMHRYAERTIQVMRLWETAFAGRRGLVRVMATQHVVPSSAEIALSFRNAARHVDALATAPYFGSILGGTTQTRESSLEHLATELPATLKYAVANRRVATTYGKRYIAYEGGQGLVLPAQVSLADQLQHDPAMYDLYRQFLTGWQRDVGDLLCLYYNIGRPGPYGAWGLAAWEDETDEEAPKLRAVHDTMRDQRTISAGAH